MRHTYACPMRWADLDAQGHVNNVVFVDYLQEARIDLFSDAPGDLATSVLGTQQLEYLAPLMFSFEPVLVDVWVAAVSTSSFTLGCEVYRVGTGGEVTVYLRAQSTLVGIDLATMRSRRLDDDERAFLATYAEEQAVPEVDFGTPRYDDLGHYPVKVRFSDIDLGGIVNNVKHLEYFQEGRIQVLDRVRRAAGLDTWPPIVVARQDVSYRRPLRLRPEPYDAWSWVEHIGTTSIVVAAEIRDGETVHARGRFVLVFFDLATNRPAQPPAELREAFARLAAG